MKDLDAKKVLKIALTIIFAWWILQNISLVLGIVDKIFGVLSPFIAGACLAFVLNIPMQFFEKRLFKVQELKEAKKKPKIKLALARPISLVLSIVLVVMLLMLLLVVVLPEIFNVIKIFMGYLPEIFNNIKDFAVNITVKYPEVSNQIKNINIDIEKVSKEAISIITNISSNLIVSSIQIAGSVIGFVINLVIAIVFAIYILFSKETLIIQSKKLLFAHIDTKNANYILDICSLSNNIFYNFIKGQLTEAVILGVLVFIGMLILGIPYAGVIGILMGFTSIIPVVGAFIGIIIGAILILAVDPVKATVFIIFVLILQQLENNLIYPKVVGASVGLPGIWVLLSVTVGGSLLGPLGMIIALPVVSILYTIIKDETNKKLDKKKIKINS